MARDRTLVGIDVGTTKVCTLIGEVTRANSVNVIGWGVSPSRGLRKGMVVNIEEAVASIGSSVEKAERVSGFKVVSGLVGIAGGHVTSLNSRGFVGVSHADKTIDQEDVARAVEAARVVNIPSNREIIHAIPRHFIVDGQEGIRNPIGMIGYRLDVETHIVTGATTAIQNLTKCIHRLGVDVDQIVLEPLASSEAVLTEEEKEMGVVLVDMGGGTTDLVIFIEGSAWHSGVIAVGGNNITNDIAVKLRTPLAEAEELKIQYGQAVMSAVPADEMVEVSTFGRGTPQLVPRAEICSVIQDRLVEMFQLIDTEIKRSGYSGLLPAGLVLTGGTAETEGIVDLASEVLQLPIRIGRPAGVHGLVDAVGRPSYATSVGLLLWGARQATGSSESRMTQRSGRRSSHDDNLTVAGRLKDFLRIFLP
ncbi:MAG: cell division protein FtsA [Chloroflexi bacterium]|nr:cell division protein FtsA [Chloroflexota bacterium]